MKDCILHNPRCGKSRQTLELLKSNGIELEIIEYLENPPSIDDLEYICEKLSIEPLEVVRKKEQLFKDLGLKGKSLSNKEWYEVLNKNPKLIERPIVCYKNKVAIGRPPENVLEII